MNVDFIYSEIYEILPSPVRSLPFHFLAKILGKYHPSSTLVSGAAIDSRFVTPGSIFFALKGKKVDGHDFIGEARQKGASGLVVSRDFKGSTYDLPSLYVEDVLATLQTLAREFLQKSETKVLAITGSIGKTTAKQFAATLIGSHWKSAASPLSYNSKVTLPLTVLNTEEVKYLILEMGMSEPGDIARLVAIAPPTVALLTHVDLQHGAQFPEGLRAITREKASIFSRSSTIYGLYPHDLVHKEEVMESGTCKKISYSVNHPAADFFLRREGTVVKVFVKGEAPLEFPLPLPHPAHDINFLGALALARMVEVPWEKLLHVIPLLSLPPMRFERVEKGDICFINDAYNASPEAMKKAIEHIPSTKGKGKKIAILGEMDDLGIFSEKEHAAVAEMALMHIDTLLCVGERCSIMEKIWKKNNRPVFFYPNRKALERDLKGHLQKGDVVLLKGCRALSLDLLLELY